MQIGKLRNSSDIGVSLSKRVIEAREKLPDE
jgi:hypothetical protein